MTNYVTWMQANQPTRGGGLQTQGNPAAATVSPATGVATAVAPVGAEYAVVWADVATQIEAALLKPVGSNDVNLGDGLAITWPANTPLEIPNVQAGITTIEMTDV